MGEREREKGRVGERQGEDDESLEGEEVVTAQPGIFVRESWN